MIFYSKSKFGLKNLSVSGGGSNPDDDDNFAAECHEEEDARRRVRADGSDGKDFQLVNPRNITIITFRFRVIARSLKSDFDSKSIQWFLHPVKTIIHTIYSTFNPMTIIFPFLHFCIHFDPIR